VAVYGDWSGLANSFDIGTTDESGQVTFDSNKVKNTNGEFTFTVTELVKDGLTYEIIELIIGSITITK